ncbi:MAG: hypothetical protein ABEK75_06515 [Salinibacter sp.]
MLPYTSALFALLLLPLSAGSAAGQAETFTVSVVDKTADHPYFGQGDSRGYAIDGTEGKELKLKKGATYDFERGNDNVGGTHPLYISTDPVGAGAGPYSDGVQNNGATEGETLTFTPPTDAPDSLWYQCEFHPKMGWRMALVEDSSQVTVDSDGEVLFNGTGVTINFSGTSGSDLVTVDKFNSAPEGQAGISESNVSEYRFVLEAGGSLSFDSNTEVRFDVSTLLGINDANNVTVYKRSTVGSGSFTEVPTDYDSGENELVVCQP